MHWRFSIGSHLLKEYIQINVILFVFEDVKIQNTFSYFFFFSSAKLQNIQNRVNKDLNHHSPPVGI